MRVEWVLTGRLSELQRVLGTVRGSTGGAGAIVFGEPGVGKSRLAAEVLDLQRAEGRPVRSVVGTETARGLPLGAFVGLLALAVDGSSSSPTELIAQALRELTDSGRRRMLLGVDDAHLLDAHSCLLVQQLVFTGRADVLLTIRDGEPVPDALTQLWKDGHLDRVDLEPLSEDESAALVRSVLGDRVHADLIRNLWELASGNPLYLRLLLDAGLETDTIVLGGGLWQWTGALRVPRGLRELVEARMGTVTPPVLRVVDLLALSEPLGTGLLVALAGGGPLERAERQGLVQVSTNREGGAEARLAHPLYGEVARTALGEREALRLRGELAETMADPQYGHASDTLRRATLALDSESEPPLGLLVEAFATARSLLDVRLAIRVGRAAVAAGAGFEVQAVVASAVSVFPGEDPMAELATLEAKATDDWERARAQVMRITHLAWGMAEPEAAEAILERSSNELRDSRARDLVAAVGTIVDAHRVHHTRASEVAERILQRTDLDGDTLMLSTCGLAAVRSARGRMADMDRLVSRALEGATGLGSGVFALPLLAVQFQGLLMTGHLEAAAQVAARVRETYGREPPANAIADHFDGLLALEQGRTEDALRLLLQAQTLFGAIGPFGGWLYVNSMALTRASSVRGSAAEAEVTAIRTDACAHATMTWWEPDRLIAHATAVARRGMAPAADLLNKAAETARREGQWAREVVALERLAGFGMPVATDRLADLATLVEGPRVHAALAHSQALANRDPGALAAASRRWEDLGFLLTAAECAAQAHRVAAGRLDERQTRTLQHRAAALIARCQGAVTPELLAFEHPLPLTGREREVVNLLGAGLSNREIAEQMKVSVRTVEGHLYRAGIKLDMTRSQLAAAGRGRRDNATAPVGSGDE